MSKFLLLYDANFPFDGQRPEASFFKYLPDTITITTVNQLSEELDSEQYSCLIHLHGAYFPKQSWPAIVRFLKKGKGLLHAAGAPFKRPVSWTETGWKLEDEQTAYHQQLHIHEALPVKADPIISLAANPDIPVMVGLESLFSIEPTFGIVLLSSHYNDHPAEMGSSGPMDSHIYPLLKGISQDQREIAASVVLIENTKGDYAGGRWMLISQGLTHAFWNEAGAKAIGNWARFCAWGVTEINLKTNYASYFSGEVPSITLQVQALSRSPKAQSATNWTFKLTVEQDTDTGGFTAIESHEIQLASSEQMIYHRVPLSLQTEAGYYKIRCVATSDLGETRLVHQGFWGFDAALLEQGEYLSCDEDYFRKNNRPLPIVGMTYMGSDVARKFLFIPNVSVWDRDMAQMQRAGINLLRTGIWTAWRHVMFVDGHPSEEVLRALDAFVLTTAKYGFELTFTFFSFTPELWEGVNPYLDPRSLAAQKRFITAIVTRYKNAPHIHWDLINEPSVFDPKRVFKGPRTLKDKYEITAFRQFVEKRHSAIEDLQEKWNMTSEELPNFAAILPPEQDEISFNTQDVGQIKRSQCWLDYVLFTMEVYNQWTREMSAVIRGLNPKQLITVGQDEGLTGQRPSPFFYGEVVDYTTVHSWWQLDNLIWDSVFTKLSDKPNLIQETGIMYVETANGNAKRSEEELRNILERKYAYAFATGGAGAVQWIWNINPYMDNINEAHIGAVRVDGTEKPEANVSYDFGRFMAETRDLFEARQKEETVVIYPYSNDFSNRSLAFEGTTKLSRLLSYELRLPFRALGEYHLETLAKDLPKLIIVPSALNIDEVAFTQLIEHVRLHGGILFITGPIRLNEYWMSTPRLAELIGATEIQNIVREEVLEVAGQRYPISFGGKRIAQIMKEVIINESHPSYSQLQEITIGQGKLLWSPLPIELSERDDSILAIYRFVAATAGVKSDMDWLEGGQMPGVYGKKLKFSQGELYVFVSEYAYDLKISVKNDLLGKRYSFKLEKERSVIFATDQLGKLTSTYRPHEIHVEIEDFHK